MENIKHLKNHKAWLAVLALSLIMILLSVGLTNVYALTGIEANKVYNTSDLSTAYDSIQAAIDAAEPGDTLVAGPGTYNENIVVDVDNLTIKGNVGAATTTIAGSSPAVQVEVDQFTLEGFTVSASDLAIYVLPIEDGDINITDCVFANAMYAVLMDTVVDSQVDFSGNVMSTTWRGFYFQSAVSNANITVEDNTISNIQSEAGLFFQKSITSSTVDVEDNSFIDCYNGVYAYGNVINTEMNIFGNNMDGGDYGVYTYAETDDGGISGTSVVTVEDNTFTNLSYYGVYIYYLEEGGEAIVKNNTMTDCDAGVYVDYVSYYYPDKPGSLSVESNDISDCYYGVYVEEVVYGSAVIKANNIHNACYGVYMYYSADNYDEPAQTDVQIIDNSITADEYNDGLYYGVYVYYADAVATISGNEISGVSSTERYEYGVYVGYAGYYGTDPALVEVSDNTIKFVEDGIYFDDIGYDLDAEVLVAGNDISEALVGIYLEDINSYAAIVDVIGNTVRNCDIGIYVYSIYGATDDEVYMTISQNVIDNNVAGIYLDYVTLEQDDPGIWILANDITNNGTGLTFGHTPSADDELIVVSFNNFSGNTKYAIDMLVIHQEKSVEKAPAPESFTLQAPLNWWGDATGPDYNDNGAMGDEINGLVNFDPWIQKLVITPKTSTGFEGTPRTITATLYDSNGDIADVPLAIQFVVNGANKAQGIVALVDGVATFKYTGNNTGTDVVNAGLIVVETPVEGFALTAEAIWEEAGNPDTGDRDSNWYLYTLVISLLLGLGLAGMRRKSSTE
jgi:hypothetical protein